MNTHLTIKADGKELTLPEDFSIDIDFQNPIFNDVDMFSYPVEIPLRGNRQLMKNIDDVNSDLRPVSMEHMDMRILADGMPFASGTAIMSDDEEVQDSLSMSVEPGTQSFDDLIGDLECRDIVIPEKYKPGLLIGEKIGNVHCEMSVNVSVDVKYNTGDKEKDKTHTYTGINAVALSNDFEPQALGFSYPAKCTVQGSDASHTEEYIEWEGRLPVKKTRTVYDHYKDDAVQKETRTYRNGNSVVVPKTEESYINVAAAYNESTTRGVPAYYANARVCYMHYKLDDDGSTSDDVETEDPGNERENRDKYWVLDADRPQSGICFYVMFFLDCLFDYLGVTFDKSALTAIGDLNRLVFFTTACKYDTEILHGSEDTPYFTDLDRINSWLSSRGCGAKLDWEDPEQKTVNDLTYTDAAGEAVPVVVGQNNVESITCTSTVVSGSKKISANILAMYANADNFPDASVSTILDSLENSFGIKFNYDYEQKKVTAYLMRDVFRSQTEAIDWHGQIHSMVKLSEKITGVRMCYSDESDLKEQQKNVKNQVKDYDTRYDYIEYPKNRTITNKTYEQIRSKLSNTDMNVYIDLATGNAYRIKIDSDYTDAQSMNPALFEVADMKGVEYGDCSTENEDFVVEFSSDFQPVPMNDVNYHRELAALTGDVSEVKGKDKDDNVFTISKINAKSKQTMMAAYIDEEMEHEFVLQKIRNDLSTAVADAYMTEYLTLVESYDPSQSDDGNSPLQSYDWGNAIAIMRGAGSSAPVQTYDANYDGFENMKWRMVAEDYAMTVDSIDPFGTEYDYNGEQAGVGNEERFSLKIRAFKQPEWSDVPLCNADEVDKETGKVVKKIRTRGLFDTFMLEYANFLLNRKKYIIRTSSTVAEVANVQNNWKRWYRFNGIKGMINKVSTTVDIKKGLQECEIEFYAL